MSRKLAVLSIAYFITFILLSIFSGIFGEWSEVRNEIIGFVADDGTFLDLDGNPVIPDLQGEAWEVYLESLGEEARKAAIAARETMELMAAPPVLGLEAEEMNEIIANFRENRTFTLEWWGANLSEVNTLSVLMDDLKILDDFDQKEAFKNLLLSVFTRLNYEFPFENILEIINNIAHSEKVVDYFLLSEKTGVSLVSSEFETRLSIYAVTP